MSEPILHLAKRALKEPESLRAFEVKQLAQWVEWAWKQRARELTRYVKDDYLDPPLVIVEGPLA